ncbi:MAG: GDP-mannose 4,6-dehydratase [Planctomycetota bacterium]
MRVLITGSEGFAGSHLADHCLAQGDEVWGTCRPGARVSNLAHILDQITLRVGDLTKPQFIRDVLGEARFDAIFHLAGISFVPEAELQPGRCYEVNLLGGLHVLEGIRTMQHHARVVVASSADVYGQVPEDRMPIKETEPFAPANIFAAGKAALELAVRPLVSTYGMQIVIVRPFNHTGPRQRTDFVCSTFAQQVALCEAGRQDKILVGDLTPKRDFSDVRDIIRGYRLMALHGQPGDAYNLASGQSVSAEQILQILMKMARIEVKVENDPQRMRRTQVMDHRGSYEKVHACCGWKPEVPFEKTLRDLLNHHRDLLVRQQHKAEQASAR